MVFGTFERLDRLARVDEWMGLQFTTPNLIPSSQLGYIQQVSKYT